MNNTFVNICVNAQINFPWFTFADNICSPPLGAPNPTPLKVGAGGHQSLRLWLAASDLPRLYLADMGKVAEALEKSVLGYHVNFKLWLCLSDALATSLWIVKIVRISKELQKVAKSSCANFMEQILPFPCPYVMSLRSSDTHEYVWSPQLACVLPVNCFPNTNSFDNQFTSLGVFSIFVACIHFYQSL